MKKIFSSILLVFSFPFSVLKKTKIDNFVGGLIFGAVFSLVVNIATVQVQEMIQRQRNLEAIENEIVNNVLKASNVLSYNQDLIDKKQHPNFFFYTSKYSDDVWTQSSEPLQYLVQLDPEVYTSVAGFYTIYVKSTNQTIDKIDQLRRDRLTDCYFEYDNKNTTDEEKQICDLWNEDTLRFEANSAGLLAKNGFEVLEKFHPTKDRLENPFLRFFIGDKSTRILSGK